MGKYIRKAKTVGPDFAAAMESSLGVRTRAKTLAAAAAATASGARSQAPSPPPPSANYLQLRSRRLLKPPIAVSKRQRQTQKEVCRIPKHSPSPTPRASSRLRHGSDESVGSFVNNNATASEDARKEEPADELSCREDSVAENENKGRNKCDLAGLGEASFGDNVLEFEGRDRETRESTPCSLVRDPDIIITPGSSTRPSAGANRRASEIEHRHIPTSHEMDEFFAGAEEEQQRSFIKKYNFDPVNDKPLPGRYEWEKLEP